MSDPESIEKFGLPAAVFAEPERAARNWAAIVRFASSAEVSGRLRVLLGRSLPSCADPDMALNNIERFVSAHPRASRILDELTAREPSLNALVTLTAGSQFFSDLLVRRPILWEFLLNKGNESPSVGSLDMELRAALDGRTDDDAFVLAKLREIKQREILRIGFRDLVLGQPLEGLTKSISDLADALTEAALFTGLRRAEARFGEPKTPDGKRAEVVVLGMGKLGGQELNYSSDIDLIVLYDHDGETNGRRPEENQVYFSTAIQEVVRLLQSNTADGVCYRVDLRLRPHGEDRRYV